MLLVLLSSTILSSCNNKDVHVAIQETATNSTQSPINTQPASKIPNHTEWKLVKSTKHYSIEKMGLRKYNDYYRCTVYNDKKEGIYSEIIGELNSYPKITISDDTVNPFLYPATENAWQGKPASKTSKSGISSGWTIFMEKVRNMSWLLMVIGPMAQIPN